MSDRIDGLAPATTLFGLLQRGHGRGFLQALDAPRNVVRDHIFDCVTHDYCWDHQVESRSEYYAELAMTAGVEIDRITDWLRTFPGGREDRMGETFGALGLLGELAERGSLDALQALRDYVAWGPHFDDILRDLTEHPRSAWVDLDAVVAARDDLDVSWWDVQRGEPWRSWRGPGMPLAALLASIKRPAAPPSTQPRRLSTAMSTAEILAAVDKENWQRAANILKQRKTDEDTRTLLTTASRRIVGRRHSVRDDSGEVHTFIEAKWWPCVAAIAALAGRRDRDAFNLLGDLSIRPNRRLRGRFQLRVEALRALLTMPGEWLLSLAREWITRRNRRLSNALRILEVHAEKEDQEAILRVINRTPPSLVSYAMCSAIDVLNSRFPSMPPVSRIAAFYDVSPYSHARIRAARHLSLTDPRFASTLAFECLWDCEEETRRIGAAAVDRSLPGVAERIAVLGID